MNVTTVNKPSKNEKLKEFFQKGKGKKYFKKIMRKIVSMKEIKIKIFLKKEK